MKLLISKTSDGRTNQRFEGSRTFGQDINLEKFAQPPPQRRLSEQGQKPPERRKISGLRSPPARTKSQHRLLRGASRVTVTLTSKAPQRTVIGSPKTGETLATNRREAEGNFQT